MDFSQSRFISACHSQEVDCTPVWFMRQAGRSLPEYRALRGEGSILQAIRQPELAAELTLQPVRRYGVDAAILYSDIMVPAFAIDLGVDIAPGIGPVIANPIASTSDVTRVRPIDADQDMPYMAETIRLLVKELSVPLIGFTGAPFTIASYLIEGKPTRSWIKTKAMMHSDPTTWNLLMEKLSDIAIETLRMQIRHGASAFQLFDSWVGCLSKTDFIKFVKPHIARIFDTLAAESSVPSIYFGTDTAHLLTECSDLQADVIGVDWRLPIDEAWQLIGNSHGIQGNVDPVLCVDSPEVAIEATRDVLKRINNRNGHIFNLGHGVLPEADPGIFEAMVAIIHEESKR